MKKYIAIGSKDNAREEKYLYAARPKTAALVERTALFSSPNESVSSYAGLTTAINNAPTDGTVYIIEITADILDFASARTIAVGKNIVIISSLGDIWTLLKSSTGYHFVINGVLTLQNIILDGNWNGVSTSRYGGVDVYGNFNLNTGAVIQNCSASSSESAKGGGVSGNAGSTTIINGGTIRNNTKTGTNGGGGVYVVGGGSFTMNSGEISDNTATSTTSGHGGGISSYTSTITINGGVISGNTAALNGGGVYVGSGTLTVTGGIISGNKSLGTGAGGTYNGGGIYVGSSAFTMTGGLISGNLVVKGNGGGLCINSATAAETALITISGGTISGNTTSAAGGGVYINLSATTDAAVSFTGCTIRTNRTTSNGGGIYLTSSNAARTTITLIDSEVSDNAASENAGGIYGGSYSTIELIESRIINNSSTPGISTSNGGGGIFGNTFSSLSIINSTISNNTTTSYGGGVFGYLFSAENASVIDNSAGNGGGIFINSSAAAPSTAGFTDCIISGNLAGSSGGGILGYTNSMITVSGGSVRNNTATSGGGIYGYNNSRITITDGAAIGGYDITPGNSAGTNGGGIYVVASATLNVTGNSSITNNRAQSGNGGGIYTADATYANLATDDSTVFNNNHALAAYRPPANAAVLYPNIGFTSTSIADHPLNNFDVNFTSGEILTFRVTYSANGGTGGFIGLGIIPGNSDTVLSAEETGISRFAHTFIGWNTQPNGMGTVYTPGDIIALNRDITLYAQWEALDLFSVSYDPNGGVGGLVDFDIITGTQYTVLSPEGAGISRTGFTFTGWNTLPDGSGTAYEPDEVIVIIENLILFAQWAVNLYDITYIANGGVGSHVDTVPFATGYAILSPEQADISRTSFAFTGWNTRPDGNGTAYVPDDVITITENLNLYAQWKANLYTVTYVSNGGAGSHVDTVPFGTGYVILSPEQAGISHTGFNFTGWNAQPDGNGTTYAPHETVTITKDLNLYAQWVANLYTVTYVSNGGTGSHVDTVPFGTGYVILSPEQADISRTGFNFTGWNTQPDGNGAVFAPGEAAIIIGNLILYAQWATNLYTVTYVANDGTGSHVDTVPYGTAYMILSPEEAGVIRTGFTFAGWNTQNDGLATAYAPGDVIIITENLILFAQWAPNQYTIAYVANGGIGSHADTVPYGAGYTILSPEEAGVIRSGFNFTGWNTQPGGNGTVYAPGEAVIIIGNLILYAQWEINVRPPCCRPCCRPCCKPCRRYCRKTCSRS